MTHGCFHPPWPLFVLQPVWGQDKFLDYQLPRHLEWTFLAMNAGLISPAESEITTHYVAIFHD